MHRSRIDIGCNLRYAAGLARAGLGAMIFALPLTMTLEMWQFGVTVDPLRLVLTLALSLPMLVALSWYAGFEETFSLRDNVLDAFAAIAVSAAACLAILMLFGEIGGHTAMGEAAGKLTVMSFGASIGALLTDKQFNDRPDDQPRTGVGAAFAGRLFVMGVGALFLALNIAPTEEIELIAANINPFQAVALACVSIALLGGVLRAADPRRKAGDDDLLAQTSHAFAGYGLCLALSLYVLWFFGRTDDTAFDETIECVIVLGFPASLGAGAARLILGDGGGDDQA
jgi:putative integral membrane protein (TIGR02587 family)